MGGDALVGAKLLLRGPAQRKGRRAVVTEEPVHAFADAVRRVVGVQQQDSAPHAAQDQTRWPSPGAAIVWVSAVVLLEVTLYACVFTARRSIS
jgi:hypothetical protein